METVISANWKLEGKAKREGNWLESRVVNELEASRLEAWMKESTLKLLMKCNDL